MATKDEIRQNALRLEGAGASPEKIREYVSLATREISEPLNPQKLNLPEGTSQTALNRVLGTFKGVSAEAVPAMAGSMLGSNVVSKVAGPAISGIGAAGGEAYRQLGQRAGIFPGQPPETSGEALKKIAIAGASGVGGEVLGRGVAAGVGKLVAPFKSSVTPEIQSQMKSAAELGIKPPLRNQTESPLLQGLDRSAQFAPFGMGQRVTNIINKAATKFEGATKNLASKIGAEMPPVFLSAKVDQIMKTHEAGYKAVRNRLYDAAEKLINKEVVPETKNTISAAEEIISRQDTSIAPGALSKVKAILKDVLPQRSPIPSILDSGTTSKIQSFSDLKNLRSQVGQLIKDSFKDPATTGMKSELKYLYSAMSKDLDATAAQISPAFASAIKQADSVYEGGLNFFKDTFLKGIKKQAETNPSLLWTTVIKKGSPELIDAAKRTLGPDVFNTIQAQWFDDVLRKSYSEIDGAKILSPQKLINNLGAYDEVLPNIFSGRPEILAEIGKLRDVGRLLTRGGKVASGSQTAYIRDLFDIVAGLPRMINAGLASTASGTRFLTTGVAPQIPKKAGNLSRAATAGVTSMVNRE